MGRIAASLASVMVLVSLAACQSAPINTEEAIVNEGNGRIHSYRLDNGLKILVQEDHRSPVVVSQVWYKVGGSYEHDGITGVSHVLEHMMFKGTKNYGPGEFSEIIAANGGSENAFTGKDYTAYFQRIASDRLELCLKMEADRMRHLVLDEAEFRKEVEVVKEERRMRTDDNPIALTYEQFNAAAFLNSSYRNPIIGWMQDLDSMQLDDLARWYQTWYAPNNATLVVSGNVKANEVYALAKQYFGPIEPSILPELKPRTEVPQRGERRIRVKAPAQVPYLMMGYKTPVLKTVAEPWEAYALEMLAGVLDGGNSSRISRNLIRKQEIAVQAGAGYDLYARQEALFMLDGSPANGHSIEQLEQALIAEVDAIKQTPPTAAEMDRVKAQVMAAAVYEQDSTFYQAMQLGTLETIGLGWQRKDEYLHNIQAVTAEQVQAVAKKYLIPERLTVAILDPLPIENQPMRKAAVGGMRHGH